MVIRDSRWRFSRYEYKRCAGVQCLYVRMMDSLNSNQPLPISNLGLPSDFNFDKLDPIFNAADVANVLDVFMTHLEGFICLYFSNAVGEQTLSL